MPNTSESFALTLAELILKNGGSRFASVLFQFQEYFSPPPTTPDLTAVATYEPVRLAYSKQDA